MCLFVSFEMIWLNQIFNFANSFNSFIYVHTEFLLIKEFTHTTALMFWRFILLQYMEQSNLQWHIITLLCTQDWRISDWEIKAQPLKPAISLKHSF